MGSGSSAYGSTPKAAVLTLAAKLRAEADTLERSVQPTKETAMDPKQIAHVCHDANRAITAIIKDVPLQPPWEEAPEEMIRSSVQGVVWRMDHPTAPASAQHEAWMATKMADGWVLGEKKDAEKKTHPALIPYEQLAPEIRLKDKVFTAIVLALASP